MDRHVEYVLTAEFDIDAGPTVVFQYPEPMKGNKSIIAELMVPDKSHDRTEDWTVFFLYRRPGSDQFEYNIADEQDKEAADKFYVINLVNTKFDTAAKRGAIVKSVCIITRHPFFQVFKPLLLLMLDEYFNDTDIAHLKRLYDVLNSMDMSQFPRLSQSERLLLSNSEYTQLFLEKFEAPASTPVDIRASTSTTASTNVSTTTANTTIVPQTSTTTTPLSPAAQRRSNSSAVSHDIVTGMSSVAITSPTDSTDLSAKRTSGTQQPAFYIDLKNQGQRMSSLLARAPTRDTHFFETSVPYKNMNIPIKIPTDYSAESAGDFSLIRLIVMVTSMTNVRFTTLHPQLTIYGPNTPPILVLILALLTQKRIFFVGPSTPCQEIADHVLACCSLASGGGTLRSFITHAFPYTDISKADDLQTSSGFIAGVKNPTFEYHKDWWDVIVDIENKTMKISPNVGTSPISPTSTLQRASTSNLSLSTTNGSTVSVATVTKERDGSIALNEEDARFVKEIRKMVSNHYGETSVRNRCQQYIRRFVRIATNYEEYKYGATNLWPSVHDPNYEIVPGYGYTWPSEQRRMADFSLYAAAIEGWRASRSYKFYIEDQRLGWSRPPKHVVDFEYHMDRLRVQHLSYEDSDTVFTAICSNAQDYDDINRLLSATASSNLFYLCMGLFHPEPAVRIMTAGLLQRIKDHAAGKLYFQTISRFQLRALERSLDEINIEPPPRPSFIPEDGVPF